jgi:hypothetical protein
MTSLQRWRRGALLGLALGVSLAAAAPDGSIFSAPQCGHTVMALGFIGKEYNLCVEADHKADRIAGPEKAAPPIVWFSFVVGYCNHLNAGWNFTINDIVGKLPEDVAPRPRFKVSPNVGSARDQREGALQLANERLGGLCASFQVPLESIIDLPESFRDEVNAGGAHSTSPETGRGSPPMA